MRGAVRPHRPRGPSQNPLEGWLRLFPSREFLPTYRADPGTFPGGLVQCGSASRSESPEARAVRVRRWDVAEEDAKGNATRVLR